MIDRSALEHVQALFGLLEFFELQQPPREKFVRALPDLVELAGAPYAVQAQLVAHHVAQRLAAEHAGIAVEGPRAIFAPGLDHAPTQRRLPRPAFDQRVVHAPHPRVRALAAEGRRQRDRRLAHRRRVGQYGRSPDHHALDVFVRVHRRAHRAPVR